MAAQGTMAAQGRWRSVFRFAVSTALAVVAIFLLPGGAFADTIVGTPGSGDGQFLSPLGVAIDETEGLLYVADRGNNRIAILDAGTHNFLGAIGWGVADGKAELQKCLSGCLPGLGGGGAGQLNKPTGVAVDNDPLSPSFHAIYVADSGNARIQKFSPVGGFLWMAGGGVNLTTGGNFCAAGSGDVCGAGTSGPGEGEFKLVGTGEIGGLAVGPGGVIHVADQSGDPPDRKSRVQKFSPSGSYLGSLVMEITGGFGGLNGLVVKDTGDLCISTVGVTGAVRCYSEAGTCLNCASPIDPSFNIAAIALNGDSHLFVAEVDKGSDYDATEIHEYDETGTQVRAIYSPLFTGSFKTTRLRALAPFEEGGEWYLYGTDQAGRLLYIDPPPLGPVVYPGLETVFANGVKSVKATLHSKINPEGKSTTYRFQYLEQAGFEADGWASPLVQETDESAPIGSDFELYEIAEQVTGLAPETSYRFRVIATNADAPGGVIGSEGTFVTSQPIEFEDVWSAEVTSNAAVLHTEVNPLGLPATAFFEYVSDEAYQESGFATAEKTPVGNELDLGSEEEFLVASSEVEGLAAGKLYHFRLVASNRCKPDQTIVCTFHGPEAAFRTLALPVVRCEGGNPLRSGAALYLSDCRGYEMVSPVDKNSANIEVVANITGYPAGLDQSSLDGERITYSAYRAFADPAASPYSSQYISTRNSSGWQTESISPPRVGPTAYNSAGLDYQFKAFTPDLCFGWPLQDTLKPLLDPDAIPDYPNLYRRDNCGLGAGTYEAITTGTPGKAPRDFLPILQGFSEDGSKAFFRVADKLTENATSGSQVYEAVEEQLRLVCVLPDSTSVSCAVGASNNSEREGNVTHAVSDQGDIIYWSSGGELYVEVGGSSALVANGPAQFVGAAEDGSRAFYRAGGNLFEYVLLDEESYLVSGSVLGVAGLSDNATVVYFVSTEALAVGATAGKPNLYRAKLGEESLVATLGADASSLFSPIASAPFHRMSRVSPDGDHIVFTSRSQLTGYDNTDAASGKADTEVFLYSATANSGDGRLSCISCNPSLSRPTGAFLKFEEESFWTAAWIPPWTTQFYAPRVLSDDGNRVFFNSFDALVARDANGRQDVYQWEAPGSGDCEENSEDFVASAAGCINLISSGDSPRASELVDSSTSGNDVFFKTAASLVSQDPGRIDIYDARVDGGFPPPPSPQEECLGEGCLGAVAPMPLDPLPASPNVGPGNPPAEPSKRCPKGKHKVKRKGKVVCIKNKKRAGKGRRAGK